MTDVGIHLETALLSSIPQLKKNKKTLAAG